MLVIDVRNVNEAWMNAKLILNRGGLLRESRAGRVIEFPEPVTTCYRSPKERVLFDPVRDANPFFHLMESLWMLAGRRDVAWIKHYNQRMGEFSDDGVVQHGAYGYRWRSHFGSPNQIGEGAIDQLDEIVAALRKDRDDRRCVLQMWDPNCDLGRKGKDFPCNTNVYFKVRHDRLQMTVCNRSNDIVWGCYGANVVHMSFLQEYVAAMIGIRVGTYYQVSDSWHAYVDVWKEKAASSQSSDGYALGLKPMALVDNASAFDSDLQCWMEGGANISENLFLVEVATRMRLAWNHYKDKEMEEAKRVMNDCPADDWRAACLGWLSRRKQTWD